MSPSGRRADARAVVLRNPVCVALDHSEPGAVLQAARALGGDVGALKVGLTAFVSGGPTLVEQVAELAPVFLDLKLCDIPAQVEGAVAALSRLEVTFTSVHASGGPEMVAAAAAAARPELVVLAVTVLTSLDASRLNALGVASNPQEQALRLGELALDAGANGLVCSPHEVARLRQEFGARAEGGPLLVVPGIRSHPLEGDDQRRTLSGKEALRAGADLIVVGRPITAAPAPQAALTTLVSELDR